MKDLDELRRETESDLRAARERRDGPILAAFDRMAAGQPVEHVPGPRHAPKLRVLSEPRFDDVDELGGGDA